MNRGAWGLVVIGLGWAGVTWAIAQTPPAATEDKTVPVETPDATTDAAPVDKVVVTVNGNAILESTLSLSFRQS